jgi:hypothetical protein
MPSKSGQIQLQAGRDRHKKVLAENISASKDQDSVISEGAIIE